MTSVLSFGVTLWYSTDYNFCVVKNQDKFTNLEDDFPFESVWRWKLGCIGIEGLCQQHVTKDFSERTGHIALLWQRAMVLN